MGRRPARDVNQGPHVPGHRQGPRAPSDAGSSSSLVIGRQEDDKCDCVIAQNAAHLLRCSLIAGGMGRSAEETWNDTDIDGEWYRLGQ